MAFTASTIINSTTLIVASILVILSIVNFSLTGHVLTILANHFPEGTYVYYGPDYTKHFTMQYSDKQADQPPILVSTTLSIIAGVAGIVWYFSVKKVQKPSKLWMSASVCTAFAAFLCSLTCFILATVNQTDVGHGCYWKGDGSVVQCTTELVACRSFINYTDYTDKKGLCREARSARIMLIPFMGFSFLLMALYVVQTYIVQKDPASDVSADERVARLQQEEDVSEVGA